MYSEFMAGFYQSSANEHFGRPEVAPHAHGNTFPKSPSESYTFNWTYGRVPLHCESGPAVQTTAPLSFGDMASLTIVLTGDIDATMRSIADGFITRKLILARGRKVGFSSIENLGSPIQPCPGPHSLVTRLTTVRGQLGPRVMSSLAVIG
jgi:hypothetical protein